MFNKLQYIAVTVFLLVFIATAYLANDYRKQVVALQQDVTSLQASVAQCTAAAQRVQASCMINDRIIAESSEKKTVMLNKASELLIEVAKITRKDEGANEPVKKSVPGTSVESADAKLQRLLDDAYCTAAPSDPYCSSR